jgi:hypothetical protein
MELSKELRRNDHSTEILKAKRRTLSAMNDDVQLRKPRKIESMRKTCPSSMAERSSSSRSTPTTRRQHSQLGSTRKKMRIKPRKD